jgi:DNA polymerase
VSTITRFGMDYETKSEADLEVVGLANYLAHPTTKILMAAFAEGDHKPKLWEPHRDPKPPAELTEALEDPFVLVSAWNVPFEKGVSRLKLGIDKPAPEWRDTMVKARYLSLPGKLSAAGKILGLSEDEAKDKEGDRLIQKFCSPAVLAQEGGLFGSTEAAFRDWSTDPEDWFKFGEYCKQDVVAERTIDKKCDKFPVPDHEWEAWCMDVEINETGWPVDMTLVRGAREIIVRDMERLTRRLVEITGLDNPNSVGQMLPWLRGQNYVFSSLNKTFVARALGGECPLTPEAIEALTIRKQTAKSSVKKYGVISDLVSPDGRLRNQYTFYGASRTGRWAAHGANVGNLPKAEKSVEKRLDLAVALVQKMDYEGIIKEFGNPLDVVSSTVRPSFRATPGHKLVVADLNAIENRGLGYICRCDSILQVFREGKDPYLAFAAVMYNIPYEILEAQFKAGDKSKRTNAKAPTLGCGYALNVGKLVVNEEDGTSTWTGLMGYARGMGIEMEFEVAQLAVKAFRAAYPEVKRTWKDLERAAIRAIRKPGTVVGVGAPQTDRDREYFLSKGRDPNVKPIISFKCHSDKVLEMILPSGRSLHYIDPQAVEVEREWDGEVKTSLEVTYYGKEQNKQVWGRVSTHGGKFLENADQALSRDVLVNGMKEARAMGFKLVGHTYDELIAEVPENGHLGVRELEGCMVVPPWWCGLDFPLGAEGDEMYTYQKT